MGSDFQTCTDGELARQSQAGSLSAFEELVYRFEDRIYGFAAKVCGNAADAREVTQDTFVRAFQAIAQFDCERAFGPWLVTIARRKCIDRHRAAPPRAGEPLPELADVNDPAELLARQEERRNLWRLARRRLPEAQFEVLWLRYAEDMSVAHIAQVVRKTQTHVKVMLFRARRVLACELKPEHVPGLPAGRLCSQPAPERGVRRLIVNGERVGEAASPAGAFSRAMASSAPRDARKGPV